MDEARQHEPLRVAVGADGLGGLQQVFELRKVDVRVGVIDERIQVVQRLPRSEPLAVQREKFFFLFADEVVALVGVVEPVELPDRVSRRVVVVPVRVAVLGRIGGFALFRIAENDKVFPVLQALQGRLLFGL